MDGDWDGGWGNFIGFGLFAVVLICFWGRYARNPRKIILKDIVFYPIKSCAGVHAQSALVTTTGLEYDRFWAICDPNFTIITLAEEPKLLHLVPQLIFSDENQLESLILTYHSDRFVLNYRPVLGDAHDVTVWRVPGKVAVEDGEVNNWLNKVLGKEYLLVRCVEMRGVHEEFSENKDERLSLTEGTQLLLVAEESLHSLQLRMPGGRKKPDMESFRGNFIIAGGLPFEEDTFAEFAINSVAFRGVKPCRRCKVTALNADTLEFDAENQTNETLRKVHGLNNLPIFGNWCMRDGNGVVSVGDEVRVTKRKKFQ